MGRGEETDKHKRETKLFRESDCCKRNGFELEILLACIDTAAPYYCYENVDWEGRISGVYILTLFLEKKKQLIFVWKRKNLNPRAINGLFIAWTVFEERDEVYRFFFFFLLKHYRFD